MPFTPDELEGTICRFYMRSKTPMPFLDTCCEDGEGGYLYNFKAYVHDVRMGWDNKLGRPYLYFGYNPNMIEGQGYVCGFGYTRLYDGNQPYPWGLQKLEIRRKFEPQPYRFRGPRSGDRAYDLMC